MLAHISLRSIHESISFRIQTLRIHVNIAENTAAAARPCCAVGYEARNYQFYESSHWMKPFTGPAEDLRLWGKMSTEETITRNTYVVCL